MGLVSGHAHFLLYFHIVSISIEFSISISLVSFSSYFFSLSHTAGSQPQDPSFKRLMLSLLSDSVLIDADDSPF